MAQRADFSLSQEVRTENRDETFSEERIRENATKFNIEFDKIDREQAQQIQYECDRNPESEMARSGLKAQVQRAAEKNLERQQKQQLAVEEEEPLNQPHRIDEPPRISPEPSSELRRLSRPEQNGTQQQHHNGAKKQRDEESSDEDQDLRSNQHGILSSISKMVNRLFGSIVHSKCTSDHSDSTEKTPKTRS